MKIQQTKIGNDMITIHPAATTSAATHALEFVALIAVFALVVYSPLFF